MIDAITKDAMQRSFSLFPQYRGMAKQ